MLTLICIYFKVWRHRVPWILTPRMDLRPLAGSFPLFLTQRGKNSASVLCFLAIRAAPRRSICVCVSICECLDGPLESSASPGMKFRGSQRLFVFSTCNPCRKYPDLGIILWHMDTIYLLCSIWSCRIIGFFHSNSLNAAFSVNLTWFSFLNWNSQW